MKRRGARRRRSFQASPIPRHSEHQAQEMATTKACGRPTLMGDSDNPRSTTLSRVDWPEEARKGTKRILQATSHPCLRPLNLPSQLNFQQKSSLASRMRSSPTTYYSFSRSSCQPRKRQYSCTIQPQEAMSAVESLRVDLIQESALRPKRGPSWAAALC